MKQQLKVVNKSEYKAFAFGMKVEVVLLNYFCTRDVCNNIFDYRPCVFTGNQQLKLRSSVI